MGSLGKYARHMIAVLAGFIVVWVLKHLGVSVDQGQQTSLVAALTSVLTGIGMIAWLVTYAWFEKFLKRFETLDPEGHKDLLKNKEPSS